MPFSHILIKCNLKSPISNPFVSVPVPKPISKPSSEPPHLSLIRETREHGNLRESEHPFQFPVHFNVCSRDYYTVQK